MHTLKVAFIIPEECLGADPIRTDSSFGVQVEREFELTALNPALQITVCKVKHKVIYSNKQA